MVLFILLYCVLATSGCNDGGFKINSITLKNREEVSLPDFVGSAASCPGKQECFVYNVSANFTVMATESSNAEATNTGRLEATTQICLDPSPVSDETAINSTLCSDWKKRIAELLGEIKLLVTDLKHNCSGFTYCGGGCANLQSMVEQDARPKTIEEVKEKQKRHTTDNIGTSSESMTTKNAGSIIVGWFGTTEEPIVTKPPEYNCTIGEHGGFLKYKCQSSSEDKAWRFKCHNTDEYYNYSDPPYLIKGDICTDDSHYYQACDNMLNGFKVTNRNILCENWVCKKNIVWTKNIEIYLRNSNIFCDSSNIEVKKCANRNFEEDLCRTGNVTTMRNGGKIESRLICNDQCDLQSCEDEADCNGLNYGLYCKIKYPKLGGTILVNAYLPPRFVCDERRYCYDGKDEANCTVTSETENTCKHEVTGKEVPFHNYTRCAVPVHGKGYCEPRKQQTNCTDLSRVGLTCKIDGHMSTVSKYVLCGENIGKICDDSIEKECVKSSGLCLVHKHKMCDRISDCLDDSDEKSQICKKQTEVTCKRKGGNQDGNLTLPLAWLLDEVEDCIDGRDERRIWPTCGRDARERFVTNNKTCQNVFICLWGRPGYVELQDFCDGIETCGNENEVCSLSRRSQEITTTVPSSKKGLLKQISYCLKGIENVAVQNGDCTKDHFMFPKGEIFGVETRETVILPQSNQKCENLFGEHYVYSSCTNKCEASTCPLKTPPRYEACPGQYPNRIGTIANNEYLVFLTKTQGNTYNSKHFVCDDKIKCLDYSQVCNLVEDCLDGSDESYCTNQFKCVTSGRLIPTTNKCDGTFHCQDFSDECNQSCSREILEGDSLKRVSWLIGVLAVAANSIILAQSVATIRYSTNTVALTNKALIILISLGDFLIGAYLVCIAVYDTIIFKEDYCTKQIDWIISTPCSMIGVISTIGSQLSLFAMTGLSMVRLNGITRSLRLPGEVTPANSLKIFLRICFIVMMSVSIAVIPIITAFEDYFVNGVKFADELKLFIGVSTKAHLLPVIEAYYGRLKTASLSWTRMTSLVSNMYSHDKGLVDHAALVLRVHFYGNDGVCLFKYFVDNADPQRIFVWSILALNFLCFLFISVSYILIATVSFESSKSLSQSQAAKRNIKMNSKITIIIATDFLCWIPFIIICTLHSLEILDGTQWYSVFSMIILPINSVINPLLYDNVVTDLIKAPVHYIITRISNSAAHQRFITSLHSTRTDVVIEEDQGDVNKGPKGERVAETPVLSNSALVGGQSTPQTIEY